MPSLASYQFRPGMRSITFVPDQLIAGNLKLVTESAHFAQGTAPLLRGTLVGRVESSGLCVPAVATATDGSQTPCGVVVDTVDVTTGPSSGSLYVMGEFNIRYMTVDGSWTDDALSAACRKSTLFIKHSLSNDIL